MHVQLFVTPWTVTLQALLPMEFSRQEYWSGLPCPPPWDIPNPGREPRSTALQADSLPSEPPGNLITVPDWVTELNWTELKLSLVMAGGLSCPMVCGIFSLPPGIKLTSPALEGGFLNTEPPGKSLLGCFFVCLFVCLFLKEHKVGLLHLITTEWARMMVLAHGQHWIGIYGMERKCGFYRAFS